jgi:hypothetical protein
MVAWSYGERTDQMSKTPKATEPTQTNGKATEAVVNIAEQVLAYRDKKATLSDVFRITNGAVRLLRLEDREVLANTAALQLAKRHNLLGTAG